MQSANHPDVERYINLEKQLLKKWIEETGLMDAFDPEQDLFDELVLEGLDSLCQDFYGISILGEA